MIFGRIILGSSMKLVKKESSQYINFLKRYREFKNDVSIQENFFIDIF